MSINSAVFVPGTLNLVTVDNEQIVYQQKFVSMEFTSGGGYPGHGLSLYSANGTICLTNRRVVYVPEPAQMNMASLSVPLPNLQGGTVVQPWFSANRYDASCIPVPNGGLHSVGKIKWTFKEGGAFDFSTHFGRLRERLEEDEGKAEELPAYMG
ncbi:hypothetical protein DFJ73DRAFT_855321 [Zopfochytrium polystomum]|nr:hypothetical protein DFJ73DRAFT_855321 [Zopfochytrium polystomum]